MKLLVFERKNIWSDAHSPFWINWGPFHSGCFWTWWIIMNIVWGVEHLCHKQLYDNTYCSSKSIQCICHISYVLPFRKVISLKDFLFVNSIFNQSILKSRIGTFFFKEFWNTIKPFTIPRYIFHQLEMGPVLIHFRNRSWSQYIHQLAKNDSVFQCISKRFLHWKRFIYHSLDPFLDLGLSLIVPLASNLKIVFIHSCSYNFQLSNNIFKIKQWSESGILNLPVLAFWNCLILMGTPTLSNWSKLWCIWEELKY